MSTLIVQHPCLSRIAVDAFTTLAGHPPDLSTDRLALWRRVSIEGETLEAAAEVHQVDAEIVAPDLRLDSFGLAAFDMDSTLITIECVDEIADFAGRKAEVAAITERAMRGELEFEGALRERVAMLAGLPESQLERAYAERVRLNPGARTFVRTLAASGAHCVLVSGGFDFFTRRVAVQAGFHEDRANRFVVGDGHLTGAVEAPILGREAKLATLVSEAERLGLSLSQTAAIGDGANDLAMIGAAGLGLAYRAKPVVAAQADAQIDHADLTAALYFMGFSDAEFVRD